MKTLQLCAVLASVFLFLGVAAAQEAKAKHWYRLFLEAGDEKQSIIASSSSSPADMAAAFSGTGFVALGDLHIPGSTTESSVLSWLVPAGTTKGGQVFINPRHVVYFVEWAGEPKNNTGATPAPK